MQNSNLAAILALLISACFAPMPLSARTLTDTTVEYQMKEVVVTGTKLDVVSEKLPSSVGLVGRSMLEIKNGDVVGAALQGSPGMYLRRYGGGGSLATLSVRGQNPEHTLVLVDGQRFTNFQNGNTDLGIFSLANVERIEMARGGYSSLYGADAVGGVVNIIMQRPVENLRGEVAGTIGSYGYQAYGGNIGGSIGGTRFGGDAKIVRESGDFAYYFDDGQSRRLRRRDDSDVKILNAGANVSGLATPSLNYHVSARYQDAERGSPNGVAPTESPNVARLRDEDLFGQGGIDWTGNEWIVPRINLSFHYGHESYTDPAFGSDDFYRNVASTISPELRFSLSQTSKGLVGAELTHASINSDLIEERIRNAESEFLSFEHTLSFDRQFLSEVIVYPSIRYDRYSDVTSDVSPKFGLNVALMRSPSIRLRGSYGKSFRMPTFNELYFKFGGNPGLQPERSLGLDGGLVAAYGEANRFSAEVNYFSTRTRDRIVWSLDASFNYTPKNIRDVECTGVEFIAGWKTPDGNYAVDFNSTWTTAIEQNEDFARDPTFHKRIVYIPDRVVNLSAMATLVGTRIYLRGTWVGQRFITDANDKELPPYNTVDAAARRSFALGSTILYLKGELTNILNESYQIISTYPMPLREFRLTAGVEL